MNKLNNSSITDIPSSILAKMPIRKSIRHTLLTTSIALLSVGAAQANTQESSSNDKMGLNAGLSVMALGSPYDLDDTAVKVLPSLIYDNDKVYARGSQLGGYLINNSENEVAAYFQPNGYEFDPDDAKGAFRGLDEREWSGMAGISYQRRIPYGAIKGQIETDIIGNSEGTLAKLSLATRYKTGDLTLYPSVGVEWANDTYNDYYFGVSEKESIKTGIKQYDADSSISPYINLNATYDINKDWMLSLGQRVGYLADEQADSPMVDNRTNFRTTIGVLYKF